MTTPTLTPCPDCGQLLCVCKEPEPRRGPLPPPSRPRREWTGQSFSEFGAAFFEAITVTCGLDQLRHTLAHTRLPTEARKKLEEQQRALTSRLVRVYPSLPASDQLAIYEKYPWVREL